MMSVEVEIPNLDTALTEALQEKIDAALAVADDVRPLIVNKIIHENRDANDFQMPRKTPKPKGKPTNHPEVPLVESGNMLDKSRWSVERVSETEAEVVYSPPEYYEFVIEIRPFLTPDKMNPAVRAEIERRMREAITGGEE